MAMSFTNQLLHDAQQINDFNHPEFEISCITVPPRFKFGMTAVCDIDPLLQMPILASISFQQKYGIW